MSHDTFNASSTATWIECSWSALNAVPDPPKKASTVAAADAGTQAHAVMEEGGNPEVEAFTMQLEDGETFREARVKVTDNCGGTLDYLRDNPRIVTLLDGKFGKWDVAAFHNLQLFTYSAAWLSRTPADWFRFVIYQPNGLDEDPWKQWVASRSEVEAHRDRVLAAVADRSPPKPGTHCRWCKAFQQCPAMMTDAGFVIGAMSRPPESLTPDELVRLLRLIRALGDVKEAYEDVLAVKLKLGNAVEGASLKPKRAYRAWNDPAQAAEYGYQQYGAKAIKPVSPAQFEKLGLEGKKYAAIGSHKPDTGEMTVSY